MTGSYQWKNHTYYLITARRRQFGEAEHEEKMHKIYGFLKIVYHWIFTFFFGLVRYIMCSFIAGSGTRQVNLAYVDCSGIYCWLSISLIGIGSAKSILKLNWAVKYITIIVCFRPR